MSALTGPDPFPHMDTRKPVIHYKDFATGATHFTRGRFDRWERGGPLNGWYAFILLPSSELMIPEYCLTVESRKALPPKPTEAT